MSLPRSFLSGLAQIMEAIKRFLVPNFLFMVKRTLFLFQLPLNIPPYPRGQIAFTDHASRNVGIHGILDRLLKISP